MVEGGGGGGGGTGGWTAELYVGEAYRFPVGLWKAWKDLKACFVQDFLRLLYPKQKKIASITNSDKAPSEYPTLGACISIKWKPVLSDVKIWLNQLPI